MNEDTKQTGTPEEQNAEQNGAEQQPEMTLEELQQQLEQERRLREAEAKRRTDAEKALEGEKRAHKNLQRERMSDAEKLAEQQKELEEKAKAYDRDRSGLAARQILSSHGLEEGEYADALELFVSEDAEKTKAVAEWVTSLLSKHAKRAAEAEREKVLKEMPQPPSGEGEKKTKTLDEELHDQLYAQPSKV